MKQLARAAWIALFDVAKIVAMTALIVGWGTLVIHFGQAGNWVVALGLILGAMWAMMTGVNYVFPK